MQMNLATKIANWRQEAKSDIFSINGVTDEQWLLLFHFFIRSEIKANQQHQVFVFEKEEDAEKFYSLCKELRPSLYYPDLGQGAFSGVFCSERALTERLLTLNKIHNSNEGHYIATTLSALRLKTPPSDFFKHNAFKLKISDIIPPEDLAQRLVEMGYSSAPTVEEEGTFSKKGEIFDIFPLSGRPFRIHYFDEMIEEIYEICPDTLRTLRDKPKEEADIFPLAGSALTDENITTFRANLPRPPFNFKHQKLMRQELLEKLDNHSFFPNFPLFFPLLFKESSTLFTELKDASLFHFFNFEEAQKSFALMLEEYNEAYDLSQSDQDSQELLPSPKLLYSERDPEELDSLHINDVHFGASFEQDYQNSVAIGVEPIKTYISRNHIVSTKHNKQEFIQSLIKTILNEKREKNIWIVYKNDSALKQIKNVLEPFLKAPLPNIRFLHFDLTEGFIYKNENLFFVGESDFFIHKSQKTKKRANRNNDVFAEQLSSLIAGDYVIHKEHGVGRYAGIETIELGKQKGDFIVLEYADNDKVYVPVYKLDLVQKHSNSQSNVKLANLKSKKFDLEKARASKSVKKLAFDLLELQAKRELKKGFQFSPPDELFRDFEQKFPFQETEDQIKAIEDVIEDMTNPRPMDRLICGDVGFGKTEIAMRAAFKAVLDHKQTAILVPTTVLAFQHYNTMTERFKDFAVNIEFVSRFKSAKQTSDIFQRLREGKIDILIGTHKILSEKAVFHDLGLLIVDEEQRFGVGHKEKLKSLKENIDCLTMTATPIPRTLQMSFLGIKDLSLIQTAPPKRRSIKTYLIKEDPSTIQKAIQKELKRGGQVFIVHNKVKDIEEYTHKIKQLAPEAKTIFAHGQMPEKELEKRITSFYEHKQDVLVSTTIIESGIDIPSANTMIIDRADTYGLSQLHQLRGRIGRSDKKAYAYFVIPHNRTLSAVAVKRLKALQTYAEMGAGFSLATSDLEIRGSGDILGGEQSGHIANIGLELYMELLQEAIAELKHEKTERKKPVEIQTPFHAVIPNDYISDTGLRLKYYKRLSNASTLESLQLIIDEMNDIYGLSPQSAANLFVILESRIHFAKALASSIKVNSKQIIISFDQQEVEQNVQARNKIIDFFMQRPKVYKLNADFSANCRFKDSVSPDTLLEFSKYIAQQTDPC